MLHVSSKELEEAFRRHAESGDGDASNDSKLLLQVYAVECGLKRLLLKKRGVHSTKRLPDTDLTHDLNQLLKELGSRPSFPPQIKCSGDKRQEPVERLHEALRYGVRLLERERIAAVLRKVLPWIAEELR
jgi:hypothetical protein